MENITFSLVDNDYVVKAKADIALNGNDDPLRKFLQETREKLIPGQTAHLEIEGFGKDPIIFEISNSDDSVMA